MGGPGTERQMTQAVDAEKQVLQRGMRETGRVAQVVAPNRKKGVPGIRDTLRGDENRFCGRRVDSSLDHFVMRQDTRRTPASCRSFCQRQPVACCQPAGPSSM
jgi:hypothetical protein